MNKSHFILGVLNYLRQKILCTMYLLCSSSIANTRAAIEVGYGLGTGLLVWVALRVGKGV